MKLEHSQLRDRGTWADLSSVDFQIAVGFNLLYTNGSWVRLGQFLNEGEIAASAASW